MTPEQRAAALRLADALDADDFDIMHDAATILRELAAEPVQDMQKALRDAQHTADFYRRRCEALQQWQSRMRDPERTVVCDILANGFTLDPPVPHDRYAMAAEPVQEPVAWRSKTRINNEFDSGWHLTSTEPPQTPRTIAIEPLYAAPQQRVPLTLQQVRELLTAHFDDDTLCGDDLTFVRAVERAHGIKE